MYIKDYTKIDDKVLLECIPVFSTKSVHYLREEKEGNYTIRTNTTSFLGELILNKTAMQIIKLANGENTVNYILTQIITLYNETNANLIKKDVFKILFDCSRINIIYWKGQNPFMNNFKITLSDNLNIVLAQEDDLLDIFNFYMNFRNCHDYINYLIPSVSQKEYENQSFYRAKLFSYSEEFILLKKEGVIEGIFSIKLPVENYSKAQSTVARISLISIKKELFNRELFNSILNFSKNILKEESVCDITKIRFEIIESNSDLENIENYLKLEKFSNIIILPNEFSNKSVKYLDYIY